LSQQLLKLTSLLLLKLLSQQLLKLTSLLLLKLTSQQLPKRPSRTPTSPRVNPTRQPNYEE
jgi:hypothetical protein